jgi:ribonuclease I
MNFALQKWCSDVFMIHGLWPQIDSDNYPIYCENVEYIQPTNELLKEMKNKWKECNNYLWQHKWEKHDSCIKKKQNNLSETDLFNVTLELFDKTKTKNMKYVQKR